MDLYGSICLSDIPKRLIKKADNGKLYLNINVIERKEVGKYGDTHFIVASCRKEELREGENRFIGDCKTFAPRRVSPDDVEKSPVATPEETDDLPF